jgi:hypothetical protein
MKKLLGIVVLGLLWCNVGFAECISGNCKNGQGTYAYKDGRYIGEWQKGKRHGQGTYTDSKGKYVGEWKKNKKHGQGTLTWSSGTIYVGEYKKGKMHGHGTYTWAEGDKYVGEFQYGKMHGQGTWTLPDGQKYVGGWKKGKQHGHGTYTYPDGRKYVGGFKKGKRYGWGNFTEADGTVKKLKNGRLYISEEERVTAKEEAKEDEEIAKAQSVCKKVGFTPGTEKFADCTLKMLTTAKSTNQGQTVVVGQRKIPKVSCKVIDGVDCF